MTETEYQTEIRALGDFVDDEIDVLLDAVNPSVAKRVARQAIREAVWSAMTRAAASTQVVLERQRRVQAKEQADADSRQETR